MCVQVLSVLRTVLGHLGAATHHELIRSVLSFLVSLIVSGAAGPTLDLVRDMSKKGMDPSLMRHFVELVRPTDTPVTAYALLTLYLAGSGTSRRECLCSMLH